MHAMQGCTHVSHPGMLEYIQAWQRFERDPLPEDLDVEE